MTPAEILKAAKAKIEDPAHWCQGNYSHWVDDKTCQYCAEGAMFQTPCQENGPASNDAWRFLREAAHERLVACHLRFDRQRYDIVTVNDGLGHAETMKMFDRAIELAEADSQ